MSIPGSWFARSLCLLLTVVMLLPLALLLGQTPFDTPYLWLYTKIGLITDPLRITLTQLGVALLLSISMGVVLAWLANNYSFSAKRYLVWLQLSPLLLPNSLLASVLEPLLSPTGIYSGIRLGIYSGINNYPIIYLLMRACLYNHNAEYWYASRSAGIGPLSSLWRIGVLLNRPVLVAGALLVTMEVLSDLSTPVVLGVENLAFLLNANVTDSIASGLVSQLSFSLFGTLVLLVCLERYFRGSRAFVQSVAGFKPMQSIQLTKTWQQLTATGLLSLPVIFGALLPLILMFDKAILLPLPAGSELISGSVRSVLLALSAALLATLCASLLAYGQRYHPGGLLRLLVWIASLGLVVPGLFIALTVIGPAAWLDNWFTPLWQSMGMDAGFINHSYGLALYVLIVRYLALALLILLAALVGLDEEMVYAARSLGSNAHSSFVQIEVRMIAPFIGLTLTLITIFVLRESGVLIVLLNDNQLTLNAAIHQQLQNGSIPAIAGLVQAGIIFVLLLIALWMGQIGLRR